MSVLMLELGLIEGPRARQLENDVADYAESIRKSFLLLKLCICDSPTSATIDLSQIAASVADEFVPAARSKQVDLSVTTGSSALIVGHNEAIVESARCLVDNAIRFAPRGTQVRISCHPGSSLTVEDAGPGIPEAVARFSFEPFATPPLDSACFGLGLTIATRTAGMHGGSLKMGRSEALGGARVVMRLSTPE